MKGKDPWSRTDQLEEVSLKAIVQRLESRANHPQFARMLLEYLEAIEIDSRKTVLDLGCGTGMVSRKIAAREGFSGSVLGIDLSPYLVRAAETFAGEEGLSDALTFQSGDTGSLALEDNHFDAVIAHTLLSHVEDPLSIVLEAARVLKPGGVGVIFDGDFASRTFSQSDPLQSWRDDETLNLAMVASPFVMRQMPRLLREAGLRLTACFPNVLAEVGKADFWKGSIESNRRLIPQNGAMTRERTEAWATALLDASEEGVFFGAANYYSFVVVKP